jgi:hypothetical protein
LRRARFCAGLLAALLGSRVAADERSAAQVTDPRAAGMARMPEREALLTIAEQALADGDTAAAVAAFEQAASMLHAADTEMGLVRASMQAGDYRHALAFCAHTAGAHLDSAAAGALYAWLLRAGGQDATARRVLEATLAYAPQDPVTLATRRAFDGASFRPSGVLLDLPHRMAPHALMQGPQALPPPGARSLTGGVLIDAGRRALVPSAVIEGARRVWVRNGLGRATEAARDVTPEHLQAQGLAVFLLAEPLAAGDTPLAPRDPFAGSPGFVVGYEPAADAAPAWPTLRQGFLGAFDGAAGLRRLGIDMPVPSRGGAVVFDATGSIAGLALPGTEGWTTMVPVSMFRELDRAPAAESGRSSVGRMPIDEACERGLKAALQVLSIA